MLTFAILLLVAVPVILAVCYAFHLMFEAPFLAHRDFRALRAIPGVDWILARRDGIRSRRRSVATDVVAPQESAT